MLPHPVPVIATTLTDDPGPLTAAGAILIATTANATDLSTILEILQGQGVLT